LFKKYIKFYSRNNLLNYLNNKNYLNNNFHYLNNLKRNGMDYKLIYYYLNNKEILFNEMNKNKQNNIKSTELFFNLKFLKC